VKKVIFAALATFAFASTAFAATPAVDVEAGQAQIGYSYNKLQTSTTGLGDLGTFRGNEYQLAYGLSDKLAITGDYLRSDSRNFNLYTNGFYSGSVNGFNFNSTQIGLQYKTNGNLALSAGSIKSEVNSSLGSTPTSETFGGIAYRQNISKNLESYASYLKSSNMQDWKAGITYNLGNTTSLDIGYHDYQNNAVGNLTAKGVSLGLNHKF
jgi:putative virulence related protein PagC